MSATVVNVGWAMIFAMLGALVGVLLVFACSFVVPRMVDRITPNVDEVREMARGNVAVAQYFGRVVGATIVGMSTVVAAAVLGGIIAGLH